MAPRTVAVIGAICLIAGWLAASTLTPPIATTQALPTRTRQVPATPAESPFTEELRLRLREPAAPPIMRRNPFVFGGAVARPDAAERDSEASAPALAPAVDIPVAPRGPAFSLVGIGLGSQTTAIMTAGAAVHVVKVGDVVEGHAVTEVTERSVTLASPSGGQLVLTLP